MASLGKTVDDLIYASRARWGALEKLDDGLRNKWEPPYLPSENYNYLATEYNDLIKRSELNILHLVIDALVDRLIVSGFGSSDSRSTDNEVWRWWQESHLDQRQLLVHRDAASFGDGFVLVVPGIDAPTFRVESPLMLAVEPDREDPSKVAIAAKAAKDRAWLYTDEAIVAFELGGDGKGGRWREVNRIEHAAGECPVVRFPNNLDSMGRSTSEIESVLPIQRRIHQTIMDRLLLQRSQAWRQRWAAGVKIDKDADGKAINPFNTGADTLLAVPDPDTKFGEFSQADLGGLLRAVDDDIRAVALITRTPPHYLPGSAISNISAEALIALEAALEARANERKLLWGESWEHAVRIGGAMVGYDVPDEVEVIWADLELRSEAQRVDAAMKLKVMGVPLEFLLERLGYTRQKIEEIVKAAQREEAAQARAQAAAFGVNQVIGGEDETQGRDEQPQGR